MTTLLAAMWFGHEPSYEPMILLLVTLGGLLAQTIKYVIKNSRLPFRPEDIRYVGMTDPKYIKSGLSLQFFGDKRIPHEESSDNIANWFSYFTSSISVTPKDEDGNNVEGGFVVPPSWVVFLAFNEPV
ncbi:MAG: hypothetical protein KZQ87_06780 [Candidatus Thiodiazotropha sp. (ex Cardiolucina cf. quadrata)]|nr:hypothetical protein [Candidatus Thiodiazotropha sp. (ex Cardiolucina cf. quadrata)]